MREIKFRGKRIDNGEFVYGYLIQKFSNFRVAKSYIYRNLVIYEVDPESVAQLCGHDCDGAEVYEGDCLTDGNDIFIASIHEPPQIYLTMTLIREAG